MITAAIYANVLGIMNIPAAGIMGINAIVSV